MQTPRIDTVRLSDDGSALVIIDQTLLPGEEKEIRLQTAEEMAEAAWNNGLRLFGLEGRI